MRKLVVFAVKALLLFLSRVPIADCDPGFTSLPNSGNPVYQLKGESVSLTWSYNPDGRVVNEREWAFNNNRTIATVLSSGTVNIDPAYTSKVQVTGNTLSLLNMQEEDSGSYTFRVEFTTFDPRFIVHQAQLIVVVEPKITLQESGPITIDEGNNRTLLCVASGTPKPLITWYRSSVKVQEDSGNSNYTISLAKRSDAGRYKCVAAVTGTGLSINTAEYTVAVTVQFKPEHKVNSLSSNQTVVENRDAEFNCRTDAVPNVLEYRWFKDGIQITNSGDYTITAITDGEKLTVKQAKKTSAGLYSCDGRNALGTGKKKSAYLIVNYAPQQVSVTPADPAEVTLAQSITLTCQADGFPNPSYSWKFNGQWNGVTQNTLTITNVDVQDAGNYTCHARNDFGNKETTKVVYVRYKPTFTKFTTGTPGNTVVEGTTVTLTCSANGYPAPTYTIKRQNTPVVSNGGKFEITGVQLSEEENTYSCETQNAEGAGPTEQLKITVLVAPTFSSQLPQTKQTKTETETVSYSCIAEAKPAATILWQLDRKNLTETSPYNFWVSVAPISQSKLVKTLAYLTINRVTWRQDGNFSCLAYNDAGEKSQTTELEVRYRPVAQSFADQPKNLTLEEGETAEFTCKTIGNPPTDSHKWQFNGKDIPGEGCSRCLKSTFKKSSVTLSDAGWYSCTGTNSLGEGPPARAQLSIKYPPENVQLKTSAVDGKICIDETISINCSADAVPSVTSYELFENDELIMDTSGMWSRALSSEGVFVYKCVANNSLGSTPSESVNVTVNVPSSIEPLKNKTNVQKGEDVTLYCNVFGTPTPRVSWTHVKTGEKWFSKTKDIADVKVDDLGEYKCEASNPYGNDTESIFIFFPGGLCEEVCSSGKSCRQFGQYICLCHKGKTGANCEEAEELKDTFDVGVEFSNIVYEPEYEDLEHPTTEKLVERIEDAVTGELSGSSFVSAKVKKLREGSVIADMELTFNQKVGSSEVETLLSEVTKDGKMGNLEISRVVSDGLIEDFTTPAPTEPAEVNRDVIYGTVIGILVLMLTVFITCVILRRRQRQGDNRLDVFAVGEGGPELQNEGMEFDASSENVNTTNHHATSQYMALVEVTQSSGGTGPEIPPYSEINEFAPLYPGTLSWEVPRESIIIEKIIGKGTFGQVAQGKASQLRGRDGTITVAIKMLKDNPTEKERKDLLSELEVMKKLKPHCHVIKLLGCVTESDPLLVIIEYVPYGDLLGYMRKSRGLNDTYFKDPDVRPQTSLTSQQLIKFSWQVADGMRYLSSRNIIHRDLAARNVLVGEQETCKVTDFGMVRDVNQENIYETKTKSRLPVKWTAYEALLFGRYTTKSDVWSFGIVLYEIFTIGGSPYPRTNARKMADILNRGYRMPKPSHVDEALYKIMQDCWREDPDDRPTFENLRDELKEMENQHQRFINLKDYDKKLYENVEGLMF